ncbi:serine/threonine-protein kinase [Kineosporia babensis]|uniref:Serine/threonine-protein kinase n=1 Tax=Kineosporia babensis TaxID=499548 RepID=A0A9X1NIN3_9ACTN|nr:serine/threonine-protein kinase [Kineosporia babensis]MCD5314775.1 serine/threonine-protein kinase [Kineosporia babensis]
MHQGDRAGQTAETANWPVRVPNGYRVGPWRVVSPIAAGQWGSVYAAESVSEAAEPAVALKFLPTGTLTPRQLGHLAQMANREVDGHQQLSHPHLIRCLGVHTLDDPADPHLDGVVVIVLERAEQSLEAVLRKGPAPDAPRVLEQLAQALAYLHGSGWMHGDLKPDNVLLMADGSVRVSDFGLSTQIDGTHGYLPPVGSPDYLAPERRSAQLTDNGLKVRLSADIWAFGVIAHRALTGRFPFPGADARARAEAAARYVNGEWPLALDDVPPAWRDVITSCLAPDHRSRSATDAATLLQQVRAAQHPSPAAGSSRLRLVGAAVAVLLVAALGLGLFQHFGSDDAPSGSADYRPDLLRTDTGIPTQYRQLIVEAATQECQHPAVDPPLVAAILKAESNFDADLSDPDNDEYGIARWTPRVLQQRLPAEQQSTEPTPPFPPEMSIPALGRYLCYLAPRVEQVPGDQRLNLAAAYRTSGSTVREAGGVPERLQPYVQRVESAYDAYVVQ